MEESCELEEGFPGRRFVQRAAMELAARLDQEVEVTLQLKSPLLERKNWRNVKHDFQHSQTSI